MNRLGTKVISVVLGAGRTLGGLMLANMITRFEPNKVRPQDIQCPTCSSLATFCLDLADEMEERALPIGIFHKKRIDGVAKRV